MNRIIKGAQKVKDEQLIPRPYWPDVEELFQLVGIARKGNEETIQAIAAAFRYGFLMGNHATVNRNMKRL